MEELPKQEPSAEELDRAIEELLEDEAKLLADYIAIHGKLDDALDEREYLVVQEAKCGVNRVQAKRRLANFVEFLREETQ